jgi:hypothetical protein
VKLGLYSGLRQTMIEKKRSLNEQLLEDMPRIVGLLFCEPNETFVEVRCTFHVTARCVEKVTRVCTARPDQRIAIVIVHIYLFHFISFGLDQCDSKDILEQELGVERINKHKMSKQAFKQRHSSDVMLSCQC